MKKKLLLSFVTLPLLLTGCEGSLFPTVVPPSQQPSSQQPSVNPSTAVPSSQSVTPSSQSVAPSSQSSAPSSQSVAPSSQSVAPSSQSSAPSSQRPSSERPSSQSSAQPSSGQPSSQSGHSSKEVEEYMNRLKETSLDKHFYVHYYRFAQTVEDYNDWDVWCWGMKPSPGQGTKFDWVGRTQNPSHIEQRAQGDAIIDELGYVSIDVDLTKKYYDGGWNNTQRTIGGTDMCFYQAKYDREKKQKYYTDDLEEAVGVQIVLTDTRINPVGEFWYNDGGDLKVELDKYALPTNSGGTSYHIFLTQDSVQSPTAEPPVNNVDPFDGDTGDKYTYGKAEYADVNFSSYAAKTKTSPLFYQGVSGVNYLKNGAGVGYQIMVGSFADSDGDGFGDILGITDKLDYLSDLGVNVLWLTPIQMSDSYHGYDISDYTQVDPKFGSSKSSHVENGKVTPASAMEDYKDLIKAAHAKGMAVIMDLVLNHTSTTNKWFVDSAQLNDEYRGYYQWGNNVTQKSQINEEKFWYPYGDHVYSYYAKFGSSMPELNYAYSSTRAAVASVALNWCQLGVDGFRMDAVKHIFLEEEVKKASGDVIIKDISVNAAGYEQDYSSNLTKNLHFWRQLASDVKKVYPNCFFVGENFDGHAYHNAPYYEGFDSLFDFYSYFNLTTLAAKAWGVNAGTIYGGPASAQAFFGSPTSNPGTDTEGNKWDLWHVVDKYKSYRGDNPILGAFTSNHDIARTINRIAGTGKQGDDGLSAQGNVTTSNFATLDKLATLVQITELMMPGCTWIYYGDELGMTGNFPNTTYQMRMKDGSVVTRKYDKDAPYSDLWYRQPMKWVQGAVPGDGSYTTGYDITGSSTSVEWDDINKTSLMKSVEEQQKTTGSHLKAIQAFAKVKSTTPALIRGSFQDNGWDKQYMVNLQRVLGKDHYALVANFHNQTVSMGYGNDGWKTICSYNGATGTSMKPYSAILLYKNY